MIANTTAVEFNGTKVWKDNDDANRPSSVSVRLLRNGTEIAATQATADNGWTYQFAAQPKYDKHGKAYLYSIKEAYERGYDVSYDHASAKGISLILQYQIESGDSCYVYYYKDGKLYKSEPYRGSAKMSEVVLDIPSTEFWVEFSSDYSGCSYYGMKVTSVKGLETVPGTFGKAVTGLPSKGYTEVDVNDATQIETLPHGNYGNNVKKLWHYKADGLLCDDVHITNTKLPEETTHIAIAKVDEQDELLAGAQLQLLDKQGNVVKEWVSETSAERLDGIAAGTYKIHEVSAPEGYETADDLEITISDTTDLQRYTFVNKRIIQKSTLTVSKKVTGSFGDKYKDFKFCLTLDDDSITSLSYTKGDATETVTRNADNQFEFTLSHGESVVFADLPVGTGYTVTEPDAKAEGYEVTADGATGTIQENGSTVLFTNHRNMVVSTELDTNMAVFGMILAAGCVLLIGYCLKRRKK